MNSKNEAKVQFVKKVLNERGFIFKEYANGQLQVDTVNIWATSDKWYDTATGKKGTGLNSFAEYLRNKDTITINAEGSNSDSLELPDEIEDNTDTDERLPWE